MYPRLQGEFLGTTWKDKSPRALIFIEYSAGFGIWQTLVWSRRQESNLYLALRRRPFYPLNYGEGWARASCAIQRGLAGSDFRMGPDAASAGGSCRRQTQIRSSELSRPLCARSVNCWAMR